MSHTRSYSDAGTFNLTLSVTDDDLDTTAESMAVPALMSEQALVKIIEMLDLLISGTTDPALKRNAARCSQGTAVERRQRGADKLRIAGGDSVDPPDRARRAGEGIVAVSHQIRVRRWLPSAPDVLVSSGGRSRRSLHR